MTWQPDNTRIVFSAAPVDRSGLFRAQTYPHPQPSEVAAPCRNPHLTTDIALACAGVSLKTRSHSRRRSCWSCSSPTRSRARMSARRRTPCSSALAASHGDLAAVAGIGDQAATLLALVRQLVQAGPAAGDAVACGQKPEHLAPGASEVATTKVAVQPALLEVEQDLGPLFAELEDAPEDAMHAFVDDEVANALALLPQAAGFGTYEDYRSFLVTVHGFQSGVGYIVPEKSSYGKLKT